MEVTATVLYEGALAQYDVAIKENGCCSAQLIQYKGNAKPPEQIELRKEGRHWVSDKGDNSLSDDLGYAIELKAKPLLDRKRIDGHPAGW
jgi:hypothetical protein